jgi:hypothetical protein
MVTDGDEFDPNDLYDQFPDGASQGYGPQQGFNAFIQLNDPDLFTDEARRNPVIQEFLSAPFSVTYVQFKSSTREAEYFVHKPHLAMAGVVNGIAGSVARFPDANPRIGTFVINHDATLAKSIMRALVIEDGNQAGSMVHKEPPREG